MPMERPAPVALAVLSSRLDDFAIKTVEWHKAI
jgi:hypothetical protein